MAKNFRKFESDLTTGFGASSHHYGGRFYRKDGMPNIIRRGVPFFDRFSWFHTMVTMSRWRFWSSLFIIFLLINLLFGLIYYLIGVEHLGGIQTGSAWKNYAEAFFFSAQTFTTVGYGHISPVGFLASFIATIESFCGLLGFALASGLFYGRFAMPRPFLYFSDVALIAPYKDGKALMFRTVPYKNNHLTDAEVRLTLALRHTEGDDVKNVFYGLKVEFNSINSLLLNWTIVHPLTEESPMYNLSLQELKELKAEILVFIKAFDEVFANTVVARTSYTADEIVENARFRTMYHSSEQNTATVLNVDTLNHFDLLDLVEKS